MTVACIKGQMGSNEYFQANMNVRELSKIARPAKEMDGWASMGLEERLQRELNEKRVREEIAPYLAKSEDRFFGSIIVLLYKAEVDFEPLSEVVSKVPKAYQKELDKFGFLTFSGGELIVLDGQHRYAAFGEVISGKSEGPFAGQVASDDVSVIFITHECSEKTRRIFNKLNRQAKSLSKGDNLIMSEDDGNAIVTRRLLEVDDGPLGIKDGKDLIVNWRSNTIAARSRQLTTINTVYETVKEILLVEGITDFDEKVRQVRPTDEELANAYYLAEHWWDTVLKSVPIYVEAVDDPSILTAARMEDQPYSLLLKPVGQMAFFKALIKLKSKGQELEDSLANLDNIDFSISAPMWDNVLVRAGNKMITKKEGIELASELIAYQLGRKTFTEAAKKQIEARALNAKGYEFKL
ncbi:DNA sulfur modification protein DndB [Ferrimonas balearica]|uniref:DNA sulfur modification protein DndB n=1 Tax=Ferrimonas balearica TaxID=44012 RepID=UPI001C97855E|nr:DNA sulfur modification protein DndB [Ferrimonas balearica]MBY5980217.1 DGQHR domain-containing protein [Ferrimonas balearica]